jgi:hypothetical protein
MALEGPGAEARSARREPTGARGTRPLLLAAVVVIAVVAALLVWVLAGQGDDEDEAQPTRAPAVGVSLQRLNAIAATIPHPVYWAGAQPGNNYEFTRTEDGRIYIRYLPRGTKVGTPRGSFLTVGTYPQDNAFETLRATSRRQGAATMRLRDGGLAFQDQNRPTSVYAAYPGSEYQVEVFDPTGERALELVRSGKVVPLVRPASEAASAAELKALAKELGHPIYWAGPDPETTYELTRTKAGRVYIRYLPPGVRVGDSSADYVAVGTYPQRNAVNKLKASAVKLRATTIELPGGGLAYIDTKRPTSAYIAYRDQDVQVEVYTPDPARTERLVTSRKIEPVG